MKKISVIVLLCLVFGSVADNCFSADWSAMISGTTNNLKGVWGSSGSDVFAIGNSGTILHYDGIAWAPVPSPTPNNLNSVWGSSSSDVFAVGDSGTILHYDGTSWSPVPSPTTNNLNDVWVISASDVFIVGDSGTILHYDGSALVPLPSPTPNNLNSVWGSSSSDVFAVGDSGTIIHYGGIVWSAMASPASSDLNSVWGSSIYSAYAVGDDGAFLYYTGSWSIPMPPGTFTVNLNTIWGRKGNDIFLVGDGGTIGHFGGIPGGFMDSGTTENLYDVWSSSGVDNFVVGSNGTILYYKTPPSCISVNPQSGYKGQTIDVTIIGSNSNFTQTYSTVSFGCTGITINSTTVSSSTEITANISIAPDAPEGQCNVTVTTGSEIVTCDNAFSIISPQPPSCYINPSDGYTGQTLDVTIIGSDTYFIDTVSSVSFGCTGITINSTTVMSSTEVIANITIAPDAQPAFCNVTVTTGSEVVRCDNAFSIIPLQPPSCVSVNPQSGYKGQTLDVTIIGSDSHFIDTGSNVSFSCTGITVNSTTVSSPTEISVNISIAPDAPVSYCNVTVITGSEILTCLKSFSIIPPPPNANLKDLLIYYASLYNSPQTPVPMFAKKVVAKAQPDECYDGIGNPYPAGPPCSEGQPKVNQAYVWGLTQQGNVWFGTAPNVLCLVIGGILQSESTPIEAPTFVCEFGESQLVQLIPTLPAAIGDWRPPKIYEYNPATLDIEDKTPLAGRLINKTLGLRSAGSLNEVIFLAGPNLGGGINMFAFKSDGTSLGSRTLSEYSDIRKWIVVDGVLYAAVGNTAGGGSVLRWIGDDINPFQFEIVGKLDNEGSNIALHEGRLFVTTWPAKVGQSPPIGLYMSPVVPPGGLTSADTNNWVKVWKATDYEPDTLVVRTYGGGDLASFDGTLFWGTMHVPFVATQVALKAAEQGLINLDPVGDGLGTDDLLTTALGTHRAINIFAGKNFGTPNQQIELLYGDQYLPVYDPDAKSYTIAFDDTHKNKMKSVPKYGPSGIGNFYNAYTWTMGVGFKNTDGFNSLLVGTFDWSYVLEQMIIALVMQQFGQNSVTPGMTIDSATIKDFMDQLPSPGFGADLFVANGADEPFTLESNDGAGNYLNYGIRTMLPSVSPPAQQGFACQTTTQDIYYLGMANPMNLATDPSKPLGGWELIQLCSPPQVSIVIPQAGQVLQDGVIFQAQAADMCGVDKVQFHLRKAGRPNGIPIRLEHLPATFNSSKCLWEYLFDTTKLQDSDYVIFATASDNEENEGKSAVIPFSIRNLAPTTTTTSSPKPTTTTTTSIKAHGKTTTTTINVSTTTTIKHKN